MYNVERLLLKALQDIEHLNDGADSHNWAIANILNDVSASYQVAVNTRRDPIQWNNTEPPQNAREYKGHPAVRGTDYMEVHHLTGTSGCSPQYPHWTWPVLGVIESETGKQLVVPGDWIFEPIEGQYVVVSATQYEAIFGERPARRLSSQELHQAGTGLSENVGLTPAEYHTKLSAAFDKMCLVGGSELTDVKLEEILMTIFNVDRAALVEACDVQTKKRVAQEIELERIHRK